LFEILDQNYECVKSKVLSCVYILKKYVFETNKK